MIENFHDKLQQAKDKIRIPELWVKCGYAGEPKAGTVNRAPWRKDQHPSFSIDRDGKLWNDFAEGKGGDAITFLERALGLSRGDACKRLIEMALGTAALTERGQRAQTPSYIPERRDKPEFPELHKGTDEELSQLSALRKISIDALRHAESLGLLYFCYYQYQPAWMITDDSRVIGQVRLLNGDKIDDVKAKTLYRSWANWPVGTTNLHKAEHVALCEGGPDLLAACHFILENDFPVIPTCLLGASPAIGAGAIPLFHRKHVIIFRHNEKPKPVLVDGNWITPEKSAGDIAAEKWSEQLQRVASSVKIYQFPEGIKDLNDLVIAQPNTKVMTYENQ